MNRLANRRLLARSGRSPAVTPRFFLDTDVFIASFDRRRRRRHEDAHELISTALSAGVGFVSPLVIQEFVSAALQEFSVPLTAPDCRLYIEEVLMPLCCTTPAAALYPRALAIRERSEWDFRDCLIIASAQEIGCRTLFSQRLPHWQRFDSLLFVNPFDRSRTVDVAME